MSGLTTPPVTRPRPELLDPSRRGKERAVAKAGEKARTDPRPPAGTTSSGRAGSSRRKSALTAATTVVGRTERPRRKSWRPVRPRGPALKLLVQPGVRARRRASSGRRAWHALRATSAGTRTTTVSRRRRRRKSQDVAGRGLPALLPPRRRRPSLDGPAVLVQPVRARSSYTSSTVPVNRWSAWRWWLLGPATLATKPSCMEDR